MWAGTSRRSCSSSPSSTSSAPSLTPRLTFLIGSSRTRIVPPPLATTCSRASDPHEKDYDHAHDHLRGACRAHVACDYLTQGAGKRTAYSYHPAAHAGRGLGLCDTHLPCRESSVSGRAPYGTRLEEGGQHDSP